MGKGFVSDEYANKSWVKMVYIKNLLMP